MLVCIYYNTQRAVYAFISFIVSHHLPHITCGFMASHYWRHFNNGASEGAGQGALYISYPGSICALYAYHQDRGELLCLSRGGDRSGSGGGCRNGGR